MSTDAPNEGATFTPEQVEEGKRLVLAMKAGTRARIELGLLALAVAPMHARGGRRTAGQTQMSALAPFAEAVGVSARTLEVARGLAVFYGRKLDIVEAYDIEALLLAKGDNGATLGDALRKLAKWYADGLTIAEMRLAVRGDRRPAIRTTVEDAPVVKSREVRPSQPAQTQAKVRIGNAMAELNEAARIMGDLEASKVKGLRKPLTDLRATLDACWALVEQADGNGIPDAPPADLGDKKGEAA